MPIMALAPSPTRGPLLVPRPCLIPIDHSWNPPRNTGPLTFSVVPECYSALIFVVRQ